MDHEQLNILVIDDDRAMRDLLAAIITRVEHQVVTAASAEEGLEVMPFWTFQVAFIDHKLPKMDGLVLGEYLRRNNHDMTIALVTGDDDRKLQRKSRDLSIVYIQKPFDVSAILAVIEDYISGARSRQQYRLAKQDEAFEPQLATYADEITACFAMPSVPSRIESRLVETVKRSLNNLRTVGRYTERDRVVALSGLLCAKVLGVALPKSGDLSLYEEYDERMRQHGRRPAFDAAASDSIR